MYLHELKNITAINIFDINHGKYMKMSTYLWTPMTPAVYNFRNKNEL